MERRIRIKTFQQTGAQPCTGFLLPRLLATPASRVVTLSSLVHKRGTLDVDRIRHTLTILERALDQSDLSVTWPDATGYPISRYLVYVDDSWAGTPTGATPTTSSPPGLVFGYNAFATIQALAYRAADFAIQSAKRGELG